MKFSINIVGFFFHTDKCSHYNDPLSFSFCLKEIKCEEVVLWICFSIYFTGRIAKKTLPTLWSRTSIALCP